MNCLLIYSVTLVAPSPPVVVEGLRLAVFPGRITPTQAIAIDEDYSAEDAPVLDARLAMALGKEGLQARHLGLCKPEKTAY